MSATRGVAVGLSLNALLKHSLRFHYFVDISDTLSSQNIGAKKVIAVFLFCFVLKSVAHFLATALLFWLDF